MEGRKKMEEFYRKLKVGTKLKYAFTTVIVTLAIAVVVSLVSIVKMNVDTYKFYKEAYANSTLQMEIRKDIQLVGKYILWSMTTDDASSTQSYSNLAQKYADQVGKNVTALEKSYNDKKKVAELKDAIEELKNSGQRSWNWRSGIKMTKLWHCLIPIIMMQQRKFRIYWLILEKWHPQRQRVSIHLPG